MTHQPELLPDHPSPDQAARDAGRAEYLARLRERSLLREFQEYARGKGRLKVFRTEAVRAGFKHAWHERDYRLIAKVAERLPE